MNYTQNPESSDNLPKKIQISPPYESVPFKNQPLPITLTADDLRFILELKPIDESELLGLIETTISGLQGLGCKDFDISILDPHGSGKRLHRLFLFGVGTDRPHSPHALNIARSLLGLN